MTDSGVVRDGKIYLQRETCRRRVHPQPQPARAKAARVPGSGRGQAYLIDPELIYLLILSFVRGVANHVRDK